MKEIQKEIQTYLRIPNCILQDTDLNSTDKLVMAEIHYLDNLQGTPGCWEKNLKMAKFLGVCDDTITNSIKRLHKLGRIRYAKIANHRYIYSNYSPKISESMSEDVGVSKNSSSPKSSSLSPKISETSPKSSGLSPKISESKSEDTVSIDHKDQKRLDLDQKKKNNNIILKGESKIKFSKLKKNKQSDTTDIVDFWNSFKSSGVWKSHIKFTPDMIDAIINNLKSYSVLEICQAISNYALVLQDAKYYWDYPWPLSIFLTVKTGKCKDDPKKWWRFLEENFIKETYISRYNNGGGSSQKQEDLPHDLDPELTELITEEYRKVYRPGGDFPNFTAQKHFRLACAKAIKKYKLESLLQKKNFVDEFFQIAQDTWSSKGEEVMPWDLSGTMMWDYKMPQYYQNMGIPESMIGKFNETSNI